MAPTRHPPHRRRFERGPDHDHEQLHDTPDENGEPPSVHQPGADPDASEPPVENF